MCSTKKWCTTSYKLGVQNTRRLLGTNRLRLFCAVDTLELRREVLRFLPELSVLLVVAEDEEWKRTLEQTKKEKDGARAEAAWVCSTGSAPNTQGAATWGQASFTFTQHMQATTNTSWRFSTVFSLHLSPTGKTQRPSDFSEIPFRCGGEAAHG